MGILAWIVVGLIAGWLASQVMRGRLRPHRRHHRGRGGRRDRRFPGRTLLNMPNAVNGINVTSILVAFVGAVILIAILRAVSGRRR